MSLSSIRDLSWSTLNSVIEKWSLLQDVPPEYNEAVTFRIVLYSLLVVALFGPFLLSTLFAVVSASMWLFWIVMSLSFSLVQMMYVGYQFAMISVDVGGLCLLKIFATVRSLVLYFGINVRWLWRKSGMNGSKYDPSQRARSRRKWRIAVNNCHNYAEYSNLHIDDPKLTEPDEHPLTAMNAIRISHQQFMSNIKYVEKTLKRKAIRGFRALHLIGARNRLSKSRNSLNRSKSDNNKSDTSLHLLGNNDMRPSISSVNLRHSKSSNNLLRNRSLKAENILGMTGEMLTTTTQRLKEARETGDVRSLQYLLTGIVKRNHLSVDDIMNENSRTVAECGRNQLPSHAIDIIIDYMEEVIQCLEWMADISNIDLGSDDEEEDVENDSEERRFKEMEEISNRLKIIRKLKHNTGCTALMLSGGGAITMYHLGVIKALVEAGVYEHIPVVSGTSGGSISAAMCAVKTPAELLNEVCVSTVSTDYPLGTGIMKRENIRWFPKAVDMGAYWLKNKRLVDSNEFKRTCDHYWGNITFEEAFQRTGKHVCIHVSASRAGAGGGTQKLLLNHISTPHVTIASAVAASCALPGVMNPTTLFTKDNNGNLEPFAVDGVEWIDGSVQADLPFRRISTLFNVSNFVVSQVNFHVVPLLNKAHHPSVHTLYWKMFQMFEWDIRSRALNLSRLGLFPKVFGQDLSKVFKQKYHGNITIVPRFTKMSAIGLNALLHPTIEDMQIYLQNGQVATWPYIEAIKHNLRIEQSLNSCVDLLESSAGDHGQSRESYDLSPTLGERELNNAKKTIANLQADNKFLRHRVRELEQALSCDKTRVVYPEPDHCIDEK